MSKGSKTVTIRIGVELYAAIDVYLTKRRQLVGGVEEWTVTDYVKAAIRDKLAHTKRSMYSARKKRASPEQVPERIMDDFQSNLYPEWDGSAEEKEYSRKERLDSDGQTL